MSLRASSSMARAKRGRVELRRDERPSKRHRSGSAFSNRQEPDTLADRVDATESYGLRSNTLLTTGCRLLLPQVPKAEPPIFETAPFLSRLATWRLIPLLNRICHTPKMTTAIKSFDHCPRAHYTIVRLIYHGVWWVTDLGDVR